MLTIDAEEPSPVTGQPVDFCVFLMGFLRIKKVAFGLT